MISARRTIDIFIIEGRHLVSPLGNKTFAPFVRLKFGNNKKNRTQAIKQTSLQPVWHQSFMYDTTVSELPPIEFTVFDENNGSGDFIGR